MSILSFSGLGVYIHINGSTYPFLNTFLRKLLLLDIAVADWHLGVATLALIFLCFHQIHAFTRPPPVQRKRLPRRPALQILFKPEDRSAQLQNTTIHGNSLHPTSTGGGGGGVNRRRRQRANVDGAASVSVASSRGTRGAQFSNITNSHHYHNSSSSRPLDTSSSRPIIHNLDLSQGQVAPEVHDDDDLTTSTIHNTTSDDLTSSSTALPADIKAQTQTNSSERKSKTPMTSSALPDSFAPLLSSNDMEILFNELTADLLHALHVEGGIRLKGGRHEIPLDKDPSRPQLILDIPKEACTKITAVGAVGSDGFSSKDDLDVSKGTTERSRPMLKHAGVILDPPLPLANVAPTLIHFPTLFEDNVVKYTLRRIQIVRYALDFFSNMSSFIEKMLWILESKCQIHLGKVNVAPLYKGDNKETEPQWRLSLAFSGHVLLFGWIPIPFVNVTLPTFIIPQPHALLEYLMTSQPLASARLNREKIAEQRITLAVLDTIDTWGIDVEAVATPPALSVDLTLAGGLNLAVEAMHGRDVSGGRSREGVDKYAGNGFPENVSSETLSSWTTYNQDSASSLRFRQNQANRKNVGSAHAQPQPQFDSNDLVPWKLIASLKGKMDREKVSVTVTNFSLIHDPSITSTGSKISFSGNVVICKPDPKSLNIRTSSSLALNKLGLVSESDSPSIFSMLLFPDQQNTGSYFSSQLSRLLHYDYAFDIGEDTHLDAVSFSIGASHPMLKGGTIITTILESIYAHGSLTAREDAVMDMTDFQRKRNVLKHLPAVDFTAGIQNIFIPEESLSFSDDGQTKCIPKLNNGQMKFRVVGGFAGGPIGGSTMASVVSNTGLESFGRNFDSYSNKSSDEFYVAEGIRVVVDFGAGSFLLNSESNVTEFPELDIFDDQKLVSLLAGSMNGSIGLHLRPQMERYDREQTSGTGRNVFNPLEAYEIEFSGSSFMAKITEANGTLGHRRIIIPSETTFAVSIVESIVDMAFEGRTKAELTWDFQGSSPTLQVTSVGQDPSAASHENREQVPILITSLRQGRFNINVSSVGGLTITQAVTSRENKEGLYDWKFFNAIVSPDDESPKHLMKVLHDKRTMFKILQVVKLVNGDLEKALSYVLKQVWRAKEIFDNEGVSDPGKAIPGHKMARLLSLFLCGDATKVSEILPIIRRVVAGEGLDVVNTKELIRTNISIYEKWAPEIDRALRWAEVMLGATEAPKPFVEYGVAPFSELPKYKSQLAGIPSAKEIYDALLDKVHLPLDKSSSGMVSRIAPFMSFRQIEYILQVRPPSDWQPSDLRRVRYVYSIKKKVLDISESYGGLSFLPQSFFVSVFVGEATRASLRANNDEPISQSDREAGDYDNNMTTLHTLRRRRVHAPKGDSLDLLSPAGRVASQPNLMRHSGSQSRISPKNGEPASPEKTYEVGDSLLGPHDVATLLQAGLTSSMKGSTVVQLNQRMLLDLMASQPRIFAVAVLAELGSSGGQASPRGLSSALMALLELDQSSFTEFHRIDMHMLLESWLPGLKIPRREDYLAGGRWARQTYYTALYGVAENIMEDAEIYMAFKGHVQRVRRHQESDPIPVAKEMSTAQDGDVVTMDEPILSFSLTNDSKLSQAIRLAKKLIKDADTLGRSTVSSLHGRNLKANECEDCKDAVQLYMNAFRACSDVIALDKLAFQAEWLKEFYRRNYDALMVKSVYDNVIDDVEDVRKWLDCLRNGSVSSQESSSKGETSKTESEDVEHDTDVLATVNQTDDDDRSFFLKAEERSEFDLITGIVDALFFSEDEKNTIKRDPLVHLLIPNPPGKYNFTIVSAMGVITEGAKGLELATALERLETMRGVKTVRADTGTARSFEYNASKIEKSIETAVELQKPFGLLGYSQGCANALAAESKLLSGSPLQQRTLTSSGSRLVCRQLLFSAANGSMHGPAMEVKIHRLIVMCEEFFKYQQGYCSRGFISLVLELLTSIMDSAPFHKFMCGGGGTFLHEGSKEFWREASHLPDVPTCVLRGVLEEHTTPESLEMISNLLAKQAGSALHDSQVHVYDAVGHPVYTQNRNGKILKNCDMGGSIQRTHHWSPLNEEVEFVRTKRDIDQGSFLCAKDRHVFPWVDVNARFGFIKYEEENKNGSSNNNTDMK